MSLQEKITTEHAMLLVIDLQTRLLPHIDRCEEVQATTQALIEGAKLFDLPIVATVQYVRGLGPTVEPIASALGEEPPEKMAFSVCGDNACRQKVVDANRRQVIIAGIEAHVCVQQTVLDLLAMGLQPVVCADAVSSRRARDRKVALKRMAHAGAIITTTEAVLFELCNVSGTDAFKRLLDTIKRLDTAREACTREPSRVV